MRDLGFCPIVESYCTLDDGLNTPNEHYFSLILFCHFLGSLYAINER